jgi:vacuolar-type H+-ATPase subunit F/Vma7
MRPPIYIGDEVNGAAFRLAGLDVRIAEAGQVASTLEAAQSQAELVLVSAAAAAELPADRLAAAVAAQSPLIVVVPDPVGGTPMPELAKRLRRHLGMEG